MAYTISTHNGSKVARQHNLRNEKVVTKESHIEKEGMHITWVDIALEKLYRLIFGDAQARYNEEQKNKGHAERQIQSYYKQIRDDKKKHLVYEMIIQVGSYEKHPDELMCRQILKEFTDSWNERNPNLVLSGVYYHADEQGAPHMHIDYVPVAYELTRGMDTQNALVKALNQMGYETDSIHDTAQIKWEKAQNEELERICRAHGLEIEHPEREKQKHLDIKEYKQQKRIEELERQNAELIDKINGLIEYHNELNHTLDQLEAGASELAHDIVNQEKTFDYERTR